MYELGASDVAVIGAKAREVASQTAAMLTRLVPTLLLRSAAGNE